MTLTIRPALPADLPVLCEYNRLLAWESERKALDPAILQQGVQALLSDPHKGQYFVAELEGRVVGQTLLTYEWSDWRFGWMWWLQSVYVGEQARRRGVFRALYQHIYQSAVQAGNVVGLRLYVENENHRAQATYKDVGMDQVAYLVYERCPL